MGYRYYQGLQASPLWDLGASVGDYRVGRLTLPCPNGTYSAHAGAMTPMCSAPCAAGYYGSAVAGVSLCVGTDCSTCSVCADVCTHVTDMCMHMRVHMCMDMRMDMCLGMCKRLSSHVRRHVA